MRADRPVLAKVFDDLLAAGLERTGNDPQSGKPSPLRVFLKRTRDRVLFGVEAVGPFLAGRERKALFVREGDSREAGGGSDGKPAPGERPRLERAVEVLRRHEGVLRVESERLHRDPADSSRWIGKTTFLADLPLPRREEAREGPPREAGREFPAAPETGSSPVPQAAEAPQPAAEAAAPAAIDSARRRCLRVPEAGRSSPTTAACRHSTHPREIRPLAGHPGPAGRAPRVKLAFAGVDPPGLVPHWVTIQGPSPVTWPLTWAFLPRPGPGRTPWPGWEPPAATRRGALPAGASEADLPVRS